MRDLPERVGSKYKFVILTARRCEMLQKGARPKIDTSGLTKYSTIAMEEVLDDLVEFEMESEEEKVEEQKPEEGSSAMGLF